NKILSVNVLEHRTMKGRKAESVIPDRIVQLQSTDVDVVSGATYSSLAIMNAAQLAIDKSADTGN
ncbi:MAG: FMN-binding protein, partial [Desulfobacterales bacterium]|nr:FMN-binding protein [Desulfobacterales bacterium]